MESIIPFFPPVKFDLGFLEVHGFGIMVAVGLWLGTNMAMDKAKRDGLDPDIINRVVTWMIFGIFVGGHLGHALFYEPHKLTEGPGLTEDLPNWTYIFRIWDGLSSFGGFIVTAFLCWLFFKKENKRVKSKNKKRQKDPDKKLLFPVRPTHYGDCVIYGFPMAFGLGRVGCFMAHDHPGLQTDFWLAVPGICKQGSTPAVDGACPTGWTFEAGSSFSSDYCYNTQIACHDLGLYEAMWALSLIPIVRYLDKKKARFQGFFLAFIPMYYAPFRLYFDSLRTNDAQYYGFTPAQYGAMILFTIGFTLFLWLRKTTPVRQLTAKSDAIPFDPDELKQA